MFAHACYWSRCLLHTILFRGGSPMIARALVQYRINSGIAGIEAMEFGASILGAEALVDGALGDVAPVLVRIDGSGRCRFVAMVSPETVSGQYAELDFRHVEPTGVFGSVLELETSHDAAGFGRGKGL